MPGLEQSKTLKYIDLFILVKTCRLGSFNLSDTEKAVQHQLTGMGITEDMLRQDINLGVRGAPSLPPTGPCSICPANNSNTKVSQP